MKRFFVFLMLLAVLPVTMAWADIKIIPKKVNITPVAVQKSVIDEFARMLPDIVREYIEPTILGILNP